MEPIPQDVEQLVAHLCCGGCLTPRGHGFSVTVSHYQGPMYTLVTCCLRCGRTGFGRFKTEMDVPAPAGSVPEISSDESIELHEALKSDDWLSQLTGRR